jgi:hypothetical protein
MLDMNRLFGFVFYSDSIRTHNEIKKVLVEFVLTLEPDDAAVTMGEFGQGVGLITSQLINGERSVNEADFINMSKAVCKAIGEAEINSPKYVFVISDRFSEEMAFTIYKMTTLNETYSYAPRLQFIQLNPAVTPESSDPRWLVVSDARQLKSEIERIVKEISECYQKT